MIFNKATAEELKQYAIDELGLNLSLTMRSETMRQRIMDECGIQGKQIPTSQIDGGKDDKSDYISIIVSKTDKKTGAEPIFVGVQGVGYTIPRGIPIGVPKAVVEVLKNAITDVITQDEDSGDLLSEEVQTYPFQVLAA